MDPISIIGLTGSLISIGEVITKSIKHLIDLHSRYQNASLAVTLLIGQLTTVKAALQEVLTWIKSSLEGITEHELLVKDLDTSIGSCKIVVAFLDERINLLVLNQKNANDLPVRGRLKFLWDENEMGEFTNHLNNQINALNLLLTAIQCRGTFDRNALLRDNESRYIIRQVEDNQSSLMVRTARSIVSDSTAQLNLDFDFDNEIITTNVYRAALRSTLKKVTFPSGSGAKESEPSTETKSKLSNDGVSLDVGSEAKQVSEILEASTNSSRNLNLVDKLHSARRSWSRKKSSSGSSRKAAVTAPIFSYKDLYRSTSAGQPLNILLLGSSGGGKSTLKRSICAAHNGGISMGERLAARENIILGVLTSADYLLTLMDELRLTLEPTLYMDNCRFHLANTKEYFNSRKVLPSEGCILIDELWHDKGFQEAFRAWPYWNKEQVPRNHVQHFFKSIKRIAEIDYIPSEEDVYRMSVPTTGIDSARFLWNNEKVAIYDVAGSRSERRKWIHCPEGASIIIFPVGIRHFDCAVPEEPEVRQLYEDLELFTSLVNNIRWKGSKFVLLFTKLDIFMNFAGTRLFEEAMKAYFPEFEGDITDLLQIEGCFKEKFMEKIDDELRKDITVLFGDVINPTGSTMKLLLEIITGHVSIKARRRSYMS